MKKKLVNLYYATSSNICLLYIFKHSRDRTPNESTSPTSDEFILESQIASK